MLELKGKYCKDCKIFTDNIEQDALSMIYHFLDHPMFAGSKIRIYHFLDHPMFAGSKIRIMPDVHAGKDIVVGFTFLSPIMSTPTTWVATSDAR